MAVPFLSVDVETANRHRFSICQIGLSGFRPDGHEWSWSAFVNPDSDFEPRNRQIHGIDASSVSDAPLWPEVMRAIERSFRDQIVVSFGAFDFQAITAACERYQLAPPRCYWLDVRQVVRCVWPEFQQFDLRYVCQRLDIPLEHHNASSDALACGLVLECANQHSSCSSADWITKLAAEQSRKGVKRSGMARAKSWPERIEAVGDSQGPLFGHQVVCTGEFDIGERELVELAAAAGCEVKERVTRKTTILVTGRRDPTLWKGKLRSNKLMTAEALIERGHHIAILSELEFLDLVDKKCREFSGVD